MKAAGVRRGGRQLALVFVLINLASAHAVLAQDGWHDDISLDEDAGEAFESRAGIYRWVSPPVFEQLQSDATWIPQGMGAIFVPSMTFPSDEPEVVIITPTGDLVADGPTARRVIVEPGTYQVRVGSGTLRQTLGVDIEVTANETTVVPVEWGGVLIEVVDENNIPHRGQYELIRVEDREPFGLGFGADTLQGERLSTWFLPTGLYRIVRPGSTYRARTDFSTVYVPPGGLVRYRLVLDQLTGEFRGAGVIIPEEMTTSMGTSNWFRRLVIGLNSGLSQSSNVVGVPDSLTLTGDLFIDTFVSYDDTTNFLALFLEIEEGILWTQPEQGEALPLQKSRDRIRFDLLYTYFLTEIFGPYVRIGTLLSVLPSQVLATEAITVRRIFLDGRVEDEPVDASNAFSTAGSFGSVSVREGVGMNVRLLRTTAATANFRLGAGFRQNFFNDAFVSDDDTSTVEEEYREVESFNQEGIEAVLAGSLRLTRFLSYTTEVELFTDFDDFANPDLDWQNTLSLRFASFASIDYTLNLLRQTQVTDEWQLSQRVLFRLSWDIL